MDAPTRMLRLMALIPVLVASTALGVMTAALLPGVGALLAMAGAVVALLAAGHLEAHAVRVLARARRLREPEQAVLGPVWSRLDAQAVPVGDVYVARAPMGAPVQPWGRRSLVLDPVFVEAVYRGVVSVDEAAGLVGHAVGRRGTGPARFDLAVATWSLPWRLVTAIGRSLGAALAWVPLGGTCWRLRGVLVPVMLYQGFTEGRVGLAVPGAAAIVLSYVVPWADRIWRARVERTADRYVVQHGLGEALAGFLHRQGVAMERLQALRSRPRAALQLVRG